MGTLVALAIPFKGFKQRLRITKQFQDELIEEYKGFMIIEMRCKRWNI